MFLCLCLLLESGIQINSYDNSMQCLYALGRYDEVY